MSYFSDRLAVSQKKNNKPTGWLYIPMDQLTDHIGPLSRAKRGEVGIILLESRQFLTRRPYHKQKIALLLGNQRAFALEQAALGVPVMYRQSDESIPALLRKEIKAIKAPIQMMEAAELEQRRELEALVGEGLLRVLLHEGWLTTREQFLTGTGAKPPWRMDAFYRHVRQQSGILMDESRKPIGGKYSHDADNRLPWEGTPPAPEPPDYPIDELRAEIAADMERFYRQHPGTLRLEALPCTKQDADELWQWALQNCLHHFGPYEDAMSTASTGLFHTRISSLLNIQRIDARQLVSDVEALDIPLNSKEGFIRQVLGWREFVRHVHHETNGFRDSPSTSLAEQAGDGGYQAWSGKSWERTGTEAVSDGGAVGARLVADFPIPPAFWGTKSGLNCLDVVVDSVWEEGWSHHISRLMILSNIASLLGVNPRELTDWFWIAYTDAWDWVVEPNVLGMSTFSLGELMTTKPYVSGSAYIDRMSDYCKDCHFDPAKNCPLRRLYWNFFARNSEELKHNPRLRTVYASLAKRSEDDKAKDQQTLERVSDRLKRGNRILPHDCD